MTDPSAFTVAPTGDDERKLFDGDDAIYALGHAVEKFDFYTDDEIREVLADAKAEVSRLSAALATAENDLRAIKTLTTQLEADIHSAHRQRHEAELERDGLYNQMDAIVEHLGIADSDVTPIEAIQRIEHRLATAERERDEARSALAQARGGLHCAVARFVLDDLGPSAMVVRNTLIAVESALAQLTEKTT